MPWIFLTCGVSMWVMADLVYTFAYANDPPFPSVADAFYLAFYPCVYVGLLLLVRRHIADFNRSLWLDGVTAALAAAAVGAAVLVEVVLKNTAGSRSAVVTIIDALWPTAVLLIAWAAWQPPGKARGGTLQARPWLVTSAVAGLVAVGIFVYDHASRLNPLALALAVATLLTVMVRTWLTFRENAHILKRI